MNTRSSAETGESNLAGDLVFFCDGSETALTSQKCELKEQNLVNDSGASSHIFFDRSLLFHFSEETQRKVKMRMRLIHKVRMLEKFLFYFWTKKGSNVV